MQRTRIQDLVIGLIAVALGVVMFIESAMQMPNWAIINTI